MKIADLMQKDVATCSSKDSLNEAARLMWEHDCGVIPVVDSESVKLEGIVTDRDICMAAYTKGVPLGDMHVSDVMSGNLETCRPEDDIVKAHDLMRRHQVRRIPITDDDGRVRGILSLNDLALSAADSKGKALQEVGKTLAEVCRHRAAARA